MKTWVVVLLMSVVAFSHVSAEVLVMWENDHLAGDEVSTTAGEAPSAGSWHADLAAAPVLERGLGGTSTAYTDTFAMRNANATNFTDAIAADRYLTFSIIAQSGKAMNLTNIFARLQAQNATSNVVSFVLMSEATGFNEGDELTTWTVGGTGNSSDWLGQPRSFDLSAVADLQNVTSAVFRIYIFGQLEQYAQVGIGRAFTANGNADLQIDGEIIDGGGDPDPEISVQGFQAGPISNVISWSAPPTGYETTLYWMPEVDAELIDQVTLASNIPDTQMSFTDSVQNAEIRGFYRTESAPAP